MTVEKFVDTLVALDKIDDKYKYAEEYCKFMIRHVTFSMKNYFAIKKEMERRTATSTDVSLE